MTKKDIMDSKKMMALFGGRRSGKSTVVTTADYFTDTNSWFMTQSNLETVDSDTLLVPQALQRTAKMLYNKPEPKPEPKPDGTDTNTDFTAPGWGTDFQVGADNGTANNFFGIIHNIAFFSTTLSAAEHASVNTILNN